MQAGLYRLLKTGTRDAPRRSGQVHADLAQCLANKLAALTQLPEAYRKVRYLVQQLTLTYRFDFFSGLKLLSVTIQ